MRNRDFAALRQLLADDVTLNSPVTDSFQFHGADTVLDLLKVVRESVDEISYERAVGGDDTWVQLVRVGVGGRSLHGAELIRVDERGLIAEMTLFFRPLPGLAAFTAAVAKPLGQRRGRVAALLLPVLVRPLVVLTRLGDQIVARLLRRTWGPGEGAASA